MFTHIWFIYDFYNNLVVISYLVLSYCIWRTSSVFGNYCKPEIHWVVLKKEEKKNMLSYIFLNYGFIVMQAAIVNSQTLEEVARLEKVHLFSWKMCLLNFGIFYFHWLSLKLTVNFPCLAYTWQVLKSGQVPADLKIPDYDSGSKDVRENDEKMVPDIENEADVEPNNVENQKNDELAAMELVSFYYLIGIQTTLFVFLYSHSFFLLYACHEVYNAHALW